MDKERKQLIKEKKLARARKNALRNRPSYSKPSKLAFVTCFFNPHRGVNRVRIYSRFAQSLLERGSRLFCIEGLFGFSSSQIPSTWQVQVDSDAIFWHKEALLNIAIQRLPDEYDAVAWIDADLLYIEPDINSVILDSLQRDPVVQPWNHVQHLGPEGEPLTSLKRSMAFMNSTMLSPTSEAKRSYPGMCWAAVREVLTDTHGMYDRCITGSGDVAWAHGVWGDDLTTHTRQWVDSLIDDIQNWGKRLTQRTGGNIGTVDLSLEHLYHGELENRQYRSRHRTLVDVDYNPRRDIEVYSNGTLKWSKYAPDALKQRVAAYMLSRKEDDQ